MVRYISIPLNTTYIFTQLLTELQHYDLVTADVVQGHRKTFRGGAATNNKKKHVLGHNEAKKFISALRRYPLKT